MEKKDEEIEKKCDNCFHHNEYYDENGTFDECTCGMTMFIKDAKILRELDIYHSRGCPCKENKITECHWFKHKE